jgi:hypothetical protein
VVARWWQGGGKVVARWWSSDDCKRDFGPWFKSQKSIVTKKYITGIYSVRIVQYRMVFFCSRRITVGGPPARPPPRQHLPIGRQKSGVFWIVVLYRTSFSPPVRPKLIPLISGEGNWRRVTASDPPPSDQLPE